MRTILELIVLPLLLTFVGNALWPYVLSAFGKQQRAERRAVEQEILQSFKARGVLKYWVFMNGLAALGGFLTFLIVNCSAVILLAVQHTRYSDLVPFDEMDVTTRAMIGLAGSTLLQAALFYWTLVKPWRRVRAAVLFVMTHGDETGHQAQSDGSS